MLWAIASSIVVIYLYRQLNAPITPAASGGAPAGTIEAEIAALNAQIAALETKIAGSDGGGVKP
ncbi:ABC transporter C-terminal domain-containing protein [Bradyrhizobium sp. ma5]|uniref:ABC transporter C-terminal domain-containing protein n=1 Tax=Bradyrhizobium sp. ma5 TaxID=3344828 RepID=UPI0035D5288A